MDRSLKGILSKRECEMLERDKYNNMEYGKEMRDEWYYGNDYVDNFDLDIYSICDDRCMTVNEGITQCYSGYKSKVKDE